MEILISTPPYVINAGYGGSNHVAFMAIIGIVNHQNRGWSAQPTEPRRA
jgi:hypothetical protein